jgi:uncharacterized protein YerC
MILNIKTESILTTTHQSFIMGKSISISLRAQALALLEEGMHMNRVKERTGLSESAIYRIRRRAQHRGYNSQGNFIFKNEFFTAAEQPRRAREMDEEKEGGNKKCIYEIYQ